MTDKLNILNTYNSKESKTEKFTKPLRGFLGGRIVKLGTPEKGKKIFKLWERILLGSFLFTVGLPYTLIAGGVLAFSKPKEPPSPAISEHKNASTSLQRTKSLSKSKLSAVKSPSPSIVSQKSEESPKSKESSLASTESSSSSADQPDDLFNRPNINDIYGYGTSWWNHYLNDNDKKILSKLFTDDAKIDLNNIKLERIESYPPPEFIEEPKINSNGKRFQVILPLVAQKAGEKPQKLQLFIEKNEKGEWEYYILFTAIDEKPLREYCILCSIITLKESDDTIEDLANIIKGETVHKLDIKEIQIDGDDTVKTFNFDGLKLYQKDLI